MLHRRIGQFLIIYFLGLTLLLLLKYTLNLSDYVIPGPIEVWKTCTAVSKSYFLDVLNTFYVAVLGQIISICVAFTVGVVGRQATWFGSFIKVAAYNVQAYPIVAIAPIIFILLGDGFISRLLIAAMICYFPLLLSVLGIMSEPIRDIEHFYRSTGRMRWQLEIKIRAFENLGKLTTVIAGSATLAMAGTIVAEFIAANCRNRLQHPDCPVPERSCPNTGGPVSHRNHPFHLSGSAGMVWKSRVKKSWAGGTN